MCNLSMFRNIYALSVNGNGASVFGQDRSDRQLGCRKILDIWLDLTERPFLFHTKQNLHPFQ